MSSGTLTITTLAADHTALFDLAHVDVDQVATFTLDTLPASGEYRFGLTGRYAASNFYHGEAQINSAGQVTLRLRKRVGGTQAAVGTPRIIWAITAGVAYRLRFAVVGTTLSIKLWPAAGREPEWWLLEETDTSLNGTSAGGTQCGVFARNDTAATTHVLTVDDYQVLRPQLATVARSQNTIVKAHPVGADFYFAHPGVLGL